MPLVLLFHSRSLNTRSVSGLVQRGILVLIAIACAWQVRVLAVNVSRISLLLVVNLWFTPRSSKGLVHKLLSTKSRQKDFR